MDLLDTPVRLVVKAPNQRVGDQTIDCALGWTVRKLKAYIAEVYPSKPKSEEQKLIYSGQLLHDHLTLKDVLRQYDRNNTHIIHLVCATARDGHLPNQTGDSSNISEKESAVSSTQPNVDRTSNISTDGIRHRHSNNEAPSRSPTTIPQMPATIPATTFPAYPTVYPGAQGLLLTPEQMAQQMLWMQQMYTQYMTQYLQYAQQPNFQPMAQPTVIDQASGPQTQPEAAAVPPNIAQPRPAAPNENVRMNAQGGPVDDDDEEFGPNHDWLDWFYILSRAIVLFSIVYFYSSLSRFLAVTLMMVMFYVYQTNWFQTRRRPRRREQRDRAAAEAPAEIPRPAEPDNNARNDDNNNRAQQNPDPADAIIDDEQMFREVQEIENLMDNDIDNPVPPADLGPSIVTVTWTFISGFFSSLIPEQPARAN